MQIAGKQHHNQKSWSEVRRLMKKLQKYFPHAAEEPLVSAGCCLIWTQSLATDGLEMSSRWNALFHSPLLSPRFHWHSGHFALSLERMLSFTYLFIFHLKTVLILEHAAVCSLAHCSAWVARLTSPELVPPCLWASAAQLWFMLLLFEVTHAHWHTCTHAQNKKTLHDFECLPSFLHWVHFQARVTQEHKCM